MALSRWLLAVLALSVGVIGSAACDRGARPESIAPEPAATATPRPSPPPLPADAPAPAVTPDPAATASPTSAAAARPTPSAEPTPTVTPEVLATATPTPTATAAPPPSAEPPRCRSISSKKPTQPPPIRRLLAETPPPVATGPAGRWQPAIREVTTDQLALGHVRFDAGDAMELMPCERAGLFFLDIETGGLEGWTWDIQLLPSPGNRYVHFPSAEVPLLHDRLTGRTYTWDPAEMSLVFGSARGTYTNSLLGWGSGADERLVFSRGRRYAVVDDSMEAVAWFELDEQAVPHAWWPHPEGTHLLMRSEDAVSDDGRFYSADGAFYSIELSDGRYTVLPNPGPRPYYTSAQVFSGGDGFAVLSRNEVSSRGEVGSCPIRRYDWALTILSEVSLPCRETRVGLSPDGRAAVTTTLSLGHHITEVGSFPRLSGVSILDATTGEELIRVKGAIRSGAHDIHRGRSRWLADSSAVVLDTRHDTRIVSLDGLTTGVFAPSYYAPGGLLIPSRTDSDRLDRPFYDLLERCDRTRDDTGCRVLRSRVVDRSGRELVSVGLTLRLVPDHYFARTSWGLTSDELRIHLVPGGPYESADFFPVLPAVIDQPPFAALTALEVDAGGSCLPLRDAPDSASASSGCLLPGAMVESVMPADDSHYEPEETTGHLVGSWVHVRTERGMEGWMDLRGLRWAP